MKSRFLGLFLVLFAADSFGTCFQSRGDAYWEQKTMRGDHEIWSPVLDEYGQKIKWTFLKLSEKWILSYLFAENPNQMDAISISGAKEIRYPWLGDVSCMTRKMQTDCTVVDGGVFALEKTLKSHSHSSGIGGSGDPVRVEDIQSLTVSTHSGIFPTSVVGDVLFYMDPIDVPKDAHKPPHRIPAENARVTFHLERVDNAKICNDAFSDEGRRQARARSTSEPEKNQSKLKSSPTGNSQGKPIQREAQVH